MEDPKNSADITAKKDSCTHEIRGCVDLGLKGLKNLLAVKEEFLASKERCLEESKSLGNAHLQGKVKVLVLIRSVWVGLMSGLLDADSQTRHGWGLLVQLALLGGYLIGAESLSQRAKPGRYLRPKLLCAETAGVIAALSFKAATGGPSFCTANLRKRSTAVRQ